MNIQIWNDLDIEEPELTAVVLVEHNRYTIGDEDVMGDLWSLVEGGDRFQAEFGDDTGDNPDFDDEYNDAIYELEDLNCIELITLAGSDKVVAAWHIVYMYDHSGILLSTSPFSCSWDSGKVGVTYYTHEQAKEILDNTFTKEEINSKTAEEITEFLENELSNEIEELSSYVSGDIYGISILDEDGDTIDGCGGFFGIDWHENGMAEFLVEQDPTLNIETASKLLDSQDIQYN